MFGRDRIARAAADIADHLQIIENVRALQLAQKELADALKSVMSKISDMQAELRAIKAETAMFAMKETQGIVNAVQGGLNQRIENLAVRLALTERDVDRMKGEDSSATRLHLPAPDGEAS